MIALQKMLHRIRQAELAYQRLPGSVQLLAVTKGRDAQTIEAAVAVGQRAFGESYLQEALKKIQVLKMYHLEWHFIGSLQANKTRLVAENFAWVHSINRYKIAERLNLQRPANLPPLNVCLEININDESTKSGASLTVLRDLALSMQALPRLRLRGLMAIPQPSLDFQQQLFTFQKIAALQQQLITQGVVLDTLSMGMSNDFEAAIAAGSHLVRIGTAIFES